MPTTYDHAAQAGRRWAEARWAEGKRGKWAAIYGARYEAFRWCLPQRCIPEIRRAALDRWRELGGVV